MKVLICPDSFKEALSALEAASAIERGFSRASGGFSCILAPLSDGGEGFVDAMTAAGGSRRSRRVTGPLGDPVEASIGILPDGRTAVIEMAAAAGLGLVPPEHRKPLEATTFGVGELMLLALDEGAERLIVGIGGSATTDGGAGMAQALGVRLLDDSGREVGRGGAALAALARIDASRMDPRVHNVEILAACDVRNPLLGPNGAASVYGPQKGASPADVQRLDAALARLAEVGARDLTAPPPDTPGAGAAGGLGWGLMAFCGAHLRSGFEVVSDALRLSDLAREGDLLVTGEGRTDATSLSGKAVGGVLAIARQSGRPCIVLSGSVSSGSDALYEHGATAVLSISDGPESLEEALAAAGRRLENTAYNLGRILSCAVPGGQM